LRFLRLRRLGNRLWILLGNRCWILRF